MKIGIDARYLAYPYTGIPIFLHDMIKYFNTLDSVNEYYLYTDNAFELDFMLNSNFQIKRIGKSRGIFWVLFELGKYIKADSIDVFWEPMHFLPFNIKYVKKLLTIHDCACFEHPEWGSWTNAINHRLFFKRSCLKADYITVDSKSTKTDVIKYSKAKEDKIEVVYIGDTTYSMEPESSIRAKYEEVLNKYGVEKQEYFVFVSTIEPRKNVETILKAYEYFRKTTPHNCKLVFVGKKGWKNRKFDELMSNNDYKDCIIITGYVSDVEKEILLRNAKALLYPSLCEGFGFPPLEAMSVGLPVITSNITSLPEVCGDAAMYLENPYDYKKLSILMNVAYCLSDEEYQLYRKKGFAQSQKFHRSDTAQRLLEIFGEL